MTTEKTNALAAGYLKLDKAVAAAEKKAKDLKKQRDDVERELIEKIREDKLDGIRYKGINFTPGYRESLRAADWDAYWAWARKDKLGVYVQRRPAVTAVREQLDAGKTVPGIEIEKISVLYVSKAAQRK